MIYDITAPDHPSSQGLAGQHRPNAQKCSSICAAATTSPCPRCGPRCTSALTRTPPCHYGADAPAIHQHCLDYYLGPCQVVRGQCCPHRRAITPAMLPGLPWPSRSTSSPGTYPDPEQFNTDFAALAPELVQHLHQLGVTLIGIDTPSAIFSIRKTCPAIVHFSANDMAILENLILKDVPEGVYELIALPVQACGFDASPVRAVLRTQASRTQ